MTTEPISALLEPISKDAPFGRYLKDDRALYRALRNRFNAAQTAYRALSETLESLADRELQVQNRDAWQALSEQAEEVLTGQSRDLEILCWFVAAQIHLENPLERLLSAILTIVELVETSWDHLQPIPPTDKLRAKDDAGQAKEIDALKLRTFVQLVGEVPGGGLLHLPLTNLPLVGKVTLGMFLAAERDGKLDGLKQEAAGEISAESGALSTKVLQLMAIQAALEKLDAALRSVAARCSEAPLHVSRTVKQIGDALRALKLLTEATGFVWPIAPETPEAQVAEAAEAETSTPFRDAVRPNPIGARGDGVSREMALQNLEALIAHFRKTEPHSPIHMLLARALRWARMPLPDLMAEVMGHDSDAMTRWSMMAGMESYGERVGVSASIAAPIAPPAVAANPVIAPLPQPATPPEPAASNDVDTNDGSDQGPTKGKISSFEW